jgi:hypothetical protein
VEYLEEVGTYVPPDPGLSSASLATFLDSVDTANSDVAAAYSTLTTEREARYNMFKSKTDGLIARCAYIRDYIGAVHPQHKKALDFKKVQKAVQKMRGIRLSKKKPETEAGKKRSVSEQSFGSMLRVGKDVLEVIKLVPGYSPSNPNIDLLTFTTFLSDIDAQNSLVAEKYEQWDDTVEHRSDLYKQLADKITQIKLAFASQFGKDSNEYKDILRY